MDGRLILHRGSHVLLLLLLHINAGFAYEEAISHFPDRTYQAETSARYTPPNLNNSQPLRFTLAPPAIFGDIPTRYGLNVEWQPLADGSPRLSAYPVLKLTPQSSVGFSLKNFRPRFDFERGGFKTSMRLRGDGIKLNIRPTDPTNRLEFDIKITDDESRLDLTYRY